MADKSKDEAEAQAAADKAFKDNLPAGGPNSPQPSAGAGAGASPPVNSPPKPLGTSQEAGAGAALGATAGAGKGLPVSPVGAPAPRTEGQTIEVSVVLDEIDRWFAVTMPNSPLIAGPGNWAMLIEMVEGLKTHITDIANGTPEPPVASEEPAEKNKG